MRLRLTQKLEVLEHANRAGFEDLSDRELRAVVMKLGIQVRLLEQRVHHLENPTSRILPGRKDMEQRVQ